MPQSGGGGRSLPLKCERREQRCARRSPRRRGGWGWRKRNKRDEKKLRGGAWRDMQRRGSPGVLDKPAKRRLRSKRRFNLRGWTRRPFRQVLYRSNLGVGMPRAPPPPPRDRDARRKASFASLEALASGPLDNGGAAATTSFVVHALRCRPSRRILLLLNVRPSHQIHWFPSSLTLCGNPEPTSDTCIFCSSPSLSRPLPRPSTRPPTLVRQLSTSEISPSRLPLPLLSTLDTRLCRLPISFHAPWMPVTCSSKLSSRRVYYSQVDMFLF